MSSPLSPDAPTTLPHRVRLDTFGCRVNKYDSTVLRAELLARGYAVTEDEGTFDTLILNTCTVTEASDQATRRLVRRTRRETPDAHIVLTGCYAEVAADEIARTLEVDRVIPNRDKDQLVDQLDQLVGRSASPATPTDVVPEWGRHTRFFFKVQEGCDVRCTFCIIPDARGNARSLSPEDVLETVRRAVARGYQEVILAGIHLGAYGRDIPGESGLGRLVRRILSETGVQRLRLGSLEPWGVRPDLIDLLQHEPRLMPSLHLPLQSGSEEILRLMRRPISARRYRVLVDQIMQARPDLTLYLDVIAGFPGETDAHFEESFEFISALPFTHLHVFPYSRRPDTPAADLPDQVPDRVKKQRVERLMALSQTRWSSRLHSRLHSTDQVLVELLGRGQTRDNLPVQLTGLSSEELTSLRGQILPVQLTGVLEDRLLATPLNRIEALVV